MAFYRVVMRVDIERIIEAESEEQARELVDEGDMMYELKHFGVDEEWIVKKAFD